MKYTATAILFLFTSSFTQAKNEGYLRKPKDNENATKNSAETTDNVNRFLNVFNEGDEIEAQYEHEKQDSTLSTMRSDSARFIVKYKSQVHMQAMHTFALASTKSSSSQVVMTFEDSDMEVVTMDDEETIAEYLASGNVDYMEPDPVRFLFDAIPSGPSRELQGEETPYGINMVKALDVSDEFVKNRKVCVIDTGYDLNHEDLPKLNVGGNNNVGNLWSSDGNGHGSHCAGTIAAVENGVGVVGVNRNGEIGLHIERLFNGSGRPIFGSTIIGLAQDCVKAGSNVISMSLGGPVRSQAEEAAFTEMYERDNVLVVAAAGNGGNTRCSWPACYDAVVSVAAIDENKELAFFSQRNTDVELSGPGVDVLSTKSGGGYIKYSGTSMACPHVAGVAALVWSHYPEKSARDVRLALTMSAEDLGAPGRDNSFGYGLVRADRALSALDGDFTFPPTSAPTPEPPCFDEPSNYVNSRGNGCSWYEGGFFVDRCTWYGSAYANSDGITGGEACCVCGGGRTEFPDSTDSPTMSPVVSTDAPTLSPIATTPSPTSGPTKTSSPTRLPTMSPTSSPTTGECRDVSGWEDSFGRTCQWYGFFRCFFFGDGRENDGLTANDACCACQ
jgi:subtilisin family serine protease